MLRNEDEVKLCQFDLRLPAGVTVATKANGKLDAKLTERAETHSVSSRRLENGDYRFVISSMDNDSFAGNEGTLLEIVLDIPATMEAGEYVMKVMNVELSVPEGNDLNVVKPADAESKLTVKSYTPGDVNNDGSVSVTDVGCTINYILEQVPSVFVFDAADMNGDKSVSVTDVGLIINFILSDGASSSQKVKDRNAANKNSISPALSLQATTEGYELMLEDKGSFIGFQFDVTLSDGTAFNGAQLTGADTSDHLLICRQMGDGKWRVVCYSPTNSNFVDGNGSLLNIASTGVAEIGNIRLTTDGFEELQPADLIGITTGIGSVAQQGLKARVQGKTLCITSDCDTTLKLYSTGGCVLRTLNLRKGQNYIDGLRAGIYFIGNHKIVVR